MGVLPADGQKKELFHNGKVQNAKKGNNLTRFWGTDSDDMVLRCAPLAYLQENGIANKPALAKAEENSLILCAGQGAYEGDALDDTQALADLLKDQGMPAHLEICL